MNTLILTPEAMFQGDLLLVNPSFPHHPLPHPDLVTVADTDILLERRAAQALDSLMAAIGGWKEIVPVSGWRALEEQQAIWEDSLAENGLPFTQTYVAYPGHSEHQTGLAIDLGRRSASIDFIRPDFPYTGLCQTFRREMARYGLIQRYPAGKEEITGIGHEPWHFRYVGVPHARLMANMTSAWRSMFPSCKNGPGRAGWATAAGPGGPGCPAPAGRWRRSCLRAAASSPGTTWAALS